MLFNRRLSQVRKVSRALSLSLLVALLLICRKGLKAAPLDDPPGESSLPVASIHLPFVSALATSAPLLSRTWGLQFTTELSPDWHAADLRLELQRGRDAGLGSIRTLLRWRDIEPDNVPPEEYDWAATDLRFDAYAAAGLGLIVEIVDYPAWATEFRCGGGLRDGMDAEWREFVRQAARRYQRPSHDVKLWEIGNEVDGETRIRETDWDRTDEWGRGQPTVPIGGCWAGREAAYVDFLGSAYETIRVESPGSTVTLGGLAVAGEEHGFDRGFFEAFLAAGGGKFMDVLSYHWFPGTDYGEAPLERHFSLVDGMRRHGVAAPIWLTETYQNVQRHHPEQESRQIAFLSREIVEMIAVADLERIVWYGFVDYPEDAMEAAGLWWHRGLVRADHTPRPALNILRRVVRATRGIAFIVDAPPNVAAYRFREPRSDIDHIVAWSLDGRINSLAIPIGPRDRVTVTRLDTARILAGECCLAEGRTAIDGRIAITVGADATIVRIHGAP